MHMLINIWSCETILANESDSLMALRERFVMTWESSVGFIELLMEGEGGHVYREGDQAADLLAQLAAGHEFGVEVI
ncbi:hypothetical protein PVK06_044816 [Gossypium arboreum]|uniref:Uncharacterized protein n=1 Tax=Gossypium arboreum TaxID=29729 RepID=A0ABR0MS93_GOSAR|nr:hypothetical protein PVK06_044816 [Gossypium arboreum]